MADRLAVRAREARGAVGQVALALLLADREADVRLRAQAVLALAALRREQRHDVVADREVAHALADRLDDARALVAEHRRRVARRVDARGGVHVRVADAAGDEAHEHLALPRLRELELLHHERLSELLQHCCTHPHGREPTARAGRGGAAWRAPHAGGPSGSTRGSPNRPSAGCRGRSGQRRADLVQRAVLDPDDEQAGLRVRRDDAELGVDVGVGRGRRSRATSASDGAASGMVKLQQRRHRRSHGSPALGFDGAVAEQARRAARRRRSRRRAVLEVVAGGAEVARGRGDQLADRGGRRRRVGRVVAARLDRTAATTPATTGHAALVPPSDSKTSEPLKCV